MGKVSGFFQKIFFRRILMGFISSIPILLASWDHLERTTDKYKASYLDTQDSFDFIIVGGGTAGSVLANRLSKNFKVLVLEAGGDPYSLQKIPAFAFNLLNLPQTDYSHKALPQKFSSFGLPHQQATFNQGKSLGGTSNINFMVYLRGHPKDFDFWSYITKDPSWSYKDILWYFKKLEGYQHGNEAKTHPDQHGTKGPVKIQIPDYHGPLCNEWIAAGKEMGYANVDLNADFEQGFDSVYLPLKNGRRATAFESYIKNIRRKRKNLYIFKYSNAYRILFKGPYREAYGVKYIRHGKKKVAFAKKEVIVSAGTFLSPKLLMLSGIGPYWQLKKLGIKVLSDLPVGQNLQDHLSTFLGPFLVENGKSFIQDRDATAAEFAKYATGKGILTTTFDNGVATLASSYAHLDGKGTWPDLLMFLSGIGIHNNFPKDFANTFGVREDVAEAIYGPFRGMDSFMITVANSRPKSRGWVGIQDKKPNSPPVIDPNYLAHPQDLKVMIEGIKLALHIAENTTAFQNVKALYSELPIPGCEHYPFRSDNYFECHIRSLSISYHHHVGTCAMGPAGRPSSVVDPELKVIGVKSLRVIDASVMPTIPSTNTMAATFMIAEKGADMIKQYWLSDQHKYPKEPKKVTHYKDKHWQDPIKTELLIEKPVVHGEKPIVHIEEPIIYSEPEQYEYQNSGHKKPVDVDPLNYIDYSVTQPDKIIDEHESIKYFDHPSSSVSGAQKIINGNLEQENNFEYQTEPQKLINQDPIKFVEYQNQPTTKLINQNLEEAQKNGNFEYHTQPQKIINEEPFKYEYSSQPAKIIKEDPFKFEYSSQPAKIINQEPIKYDYGPQSAKIINEEPFKFEFSSQPGKIIEQEPFKFEYSPQPAQPAKIINQEPLKFEYSPEPAKIISHNPFKYEYSPQSSKIITQDPFKFEYSPQPAKIINEDPIKYEYSSEPAKIINQEPIKYDYGPQSAKIITQDPFKFEYSPQPAKIINQGPINFEYSPQSTKIPNQEPFKFDYSPKPAKIINQEQFEVEYNPQPAKIINQEPIKYEYSPQPAKIINQEPFKFDYSPQPAKTINQDPFKFEYNTQPGKFINQEPLKYEYSPQPTKIINHEPVNYIDYQNSGPENRMKFINYQNPIQAPQKGLKFDPIYYDYKPSPHALKLMHSNPFSFLPLDQNHQPQHLINNIEPVKYFKHKKGVNNVKPVKLYEYPHPHPHPPKSPKKIANNVNNDILKYFDFIPKSKAPSFYNYETPRISTKPRPKHKSKEPSFYNYDIPHISAKPKNKPRHKSKVKTQYLETPTRNLYDQKLIKSPPKTFYNPLKFMQPPTPQFTYLNEIGY